MYLNEKMISNISDSIMEGFNFNGQNPDQIKKHITNIIENSMESTWKDMSLAERVGPPIWEYLHWMGAVADSENNPAIYMDSLDILIEGHPCKELCRSHLYDNLMNLNPGDYPSKLEHSIDLHNLVNQQLGKPIYPIMKAKARYNLKCDSCIFSPSVKNNRDDAPNQAKSIDSVIYYPASFRIRNQDRSRVYQSYRSNPYDHSIR